MHYYYLTLSFFLSSNYMYNEVCATDQAINQRKRLDLTCFEVYFIKLQCSKTEVVMKVKFMFFNITLLRFMFNICTRNSFRQTKTISCGSMKIDASFK